MELDQFQTARSLVGLMESGTRFIADSQVFDQRKRFTLRKKEEKKKKKEEEEGKASFVQK